ncbi:MAG: peptide chain release factor 2 [Firmicutes bacterium]|nr:peptide chain release factor 2 [Bacillota bacterium]
MTREIRKEWEQLRGRFLETRDSLEYEEKSRELRRLEKEASLPDFWEDASRARQILKEIGGLGEQLRPLNEINELLEETEILLELAEEEEFGREEASAEAGNRLNLLAKKLDQLELETMFSGEHDSSDAILSIHPGAGGLESQDWAEMLLRMYCRWAEEKGFEVELAELLTDDEAGIKSATVIIRGHRAYGLLKSEKGVHRMVRISPFDTARRRHTSFTSVDVIPQVEEEEYELNPDELKMETFRASGAGGQHVNKTDSAVRIIHLPTGLAATCQKDRSQHSNRRHALRILQARLAEMRRQELDREIENLRGPQKDIAWGNQIRSYIFHPFTLVKDHRTGVEVGQVEAVMNGELDRFINSYLRRQAGYRRSEAGE